MPYQRLAEMSECVTKPMTAIQRFKGNHANNDKLQEYSIASHISNRETPLLIEVLLRTISLGRVNKLLRFPKPLRQWLLKPVLRNRFNGSFGARKS